MSGIESLVTQVKPPGHEVETSQPVETADKRSCFSRIMCCLGTTDEKQVEEVQQTNDVSKQPSQSPIPDRQYVPARNPTEVENLSKVHETHDTELYDVGTQVPKRDSWLLPPLRPEHKHKKTLVLDLDETLVHSSFKPINDYDFDISIPLDGSMHRVFVRKRPLVDQFLAHVAKKWEVIIFTASLSKYADPLLDILDANQVVATRLFRESCVFYDCNYVKDLTMLGRKLENTVIIDNSPLSYLFQPSHAVPITSWYSDKSDRQLEDLLPFLDQLADVPDVQHMLMNTKIHFQTGGYVPPRENSSVISVQDEDLM